MSTRSVIAMPRYTGWAGRYAHSDGYPTHQARQLLNIIRREGAENATRVLCVEHYGWSFITSDQKQNNDNEAPGFGRFYADNHVADWTYDYDEPGGLEWAYVIRDACLSVFQAEEDKWKHVGDLPYDREVTDQELVAVECGEQFERCSHYAWVHFGDEVPRSSQVSTKEYLARS